MDRSAGGVTDTDLPDVPGTGSTQKVRIDALDWARGWMLVASVGVNSAIVSIPALAHASWASVAPIDLIFPLFVTLAGCGMAFAFARSVHPIAVIRRALVLAVLGLGYNAVVDNSWALSDLRVTGVLQLYAVVIVAMALLHLVTRSWQGWAALTVLLAVGHTALLSTYALRCPATLLTPDCNPSGPLDALLFGLPHIYVDGSRGHDPEGLIAILGAMVSTAAGAAVGHLLLSFRSAESRSTTRIPVTTIPIAIASGAMVLLAVLLIVVPDVIGGGPVPPMKRLWTAPFALGIASIAAVLLWVGQVALPANRFRTPRRVKGWTPIVALGRNSLLVYFGSHLLMSLANRGFSGGPSLTTMWASGFPNVAVAQIAWSVAWMTLWVALAVSLHRRGWYVKP